VVKLGGSLFDVAEAVVSVLRRSPRPLLIVPGGGRFADTVRAVGVDQDTAHWMAIAGMEQFGWYISSFGLPATDHLALPQAPTVLLPYRLLRERDPLPHRWEITSDTIAAWVACELGTGLLLLKSVDGLLVDNILQEKITGPLVSESIDPGFIPYVLEHRVRTTFLNARHPGRMEKFLYGEGVPCTIIDATF
jgi:aspartokinase-like uncharacterized kinase